MTFLIPNTARYDRCAVARAIWADVNAKGWHWRALAGDLRADARRRAYVAACRKVWYEARFERTKLVIDGLDVVLTPAEASREAELTALCALAPINPIGNADYCRYAGERAAIRKAAERRAFRRRLAELRRI